MVPRNRRRKYEKLLETRETVPFFSVEGERPITNLERFARATFIAGFLSAVAIGGETINASIKDNTQYNSYTEVGRVADYLSFFTLGSLLFYGGAASRGEYMGLKKLEEESLQPDQNS